MTWVWDQSAGTLSRGGTLVARGYAGHDWGKNNPDAQAAVGLGPVPRGRWTIHAPRTSANTGRFTLDLTPQPGTSTFGRSLFRIHGDSVRAPGTASHGCIVVPYDARVKVWDSGDRDLAVIA